MAPNQISVITPVQELSEKLVHLNDSRQQSEPTNTWWFLYPKPDKSGIFEVDVTTRSIGSVLGTVPYRTYVGRNAEKMGSYCKLGLLMPLVSNVTDLFDKIFL
jgi:hypothetical protein